MAVAAKKVEIDVLTIYRGLGLELIHLSDAYPSQRQMFEAPECEARYIRDRCHQCVQNRKKPDAIRHTAAEPY